MSNRKTIPRAEGILFFITLIWGSTFVIVKSSLVSISPLLFQGIRFTIAALLVGIYTIRDVRKTNWKTLKYGALLGVYLGVGFSLQTIGLEITTASKSGFITGMLVVFTPIFQLLIERKKPTKGNIVGVAMVATGLYLLTSPQGSAFNIGDLLTLLCAIIFAIYVVYLDIYTHDSFPREIVFWQMLVTALIGFIAAPFDPHLHVEWTSTMLMGLFYTAVFASAIATFLQSKYQRMSTPTRSAIIYSMEPVVAAILAVILVGEVLTPLSILGGGCIVGGLLVSELM